MSFDPGDLFRLWWSVFGQLFTGVGLVYLLVTALVVALNVGGFIATRKKSSVANRRDAGLIFILIQVVSTVTGMGFVFPIIGGIVVHFLKKNYDWAQKLVIPFASANWINAVAALVIIVLLIIGMIL